LLRGSVIKTGWLQFDSIRDSQIGPVWLQHADWNGGRHGGGSQYSMDLRERAVAAAESGVLSRRRAAAPLAWASAHGDGWSAQSLRETGSEPSRPRRWAGKSRKPFRARRVPGYSIAPRPSILPCAGLSQELRARRPQGRLSAASIPSIDDIPSFKKDRVAGKRDRPDSHTAGSTTAFSSESLPRT
jgi:hypothetical protein